MVSGWQILSTSESFSSMSGGSTRPRAPVSAGCSRCCCLFQWRRCVETLGMASWCRPHQGSVQPSRCGRCSTMGRLQYPTKDHVAFLHCVLLYRALSRAFSHQPHLREVDMAVRPPKDLQIMRTGGIGGLKNRVGKLRAELLGRGPQAMMGPGRFRPSA